MGLSNWVFDLKGAVLRKKKKKIQQIRTVVCIWAWCPLSLKYQHATVDRPYKSGDYSLNHVVRLHLNKLDVQVH